MDIQQIHPKYFNYRRFFFFFFGRITDDFNVVPNRDLIQIVGDINCGVNREQRAYMMLRT